MEGASGINRPFVLLTGSSGAGETVRKSQVGRLAPHRGGAGKMPAIPNAGETPAVLNAGETPAVLNARRDVRHTIV
jgi:hypothetical protein